MPSAANKQPWRFIVVDDKETREELFKIAFRGVFSLNQWATMVPVFVVVVIDNKGLASNLVGIFRNALRSLLDIGIATEHFVLQTEEFGLGTCWMGGLDETVKKTLKIPGNRKVAAIIALGYPAMTEVKHEQKRPTIAQMFTFKRRSRLYPFGFCTPVPEAVPFTV